MSINVANNMFRNSPMPFIGSARQSGGVGFSANASSDLASFDMMTYFKMMQFMQMLQSSLGAFGGQASAAQGQPQGVVPGNASFGAQRTTSQPSSPSSWTASLASQSAPQSNRASTPGEKKMVENQLEKISNHWVKPLPGSSENPQSLMVQLKQGRVDVPYDPNIPAKDINLIRLDSNHLPTAGIDGIEKYWDARTPNGLDRSKLAEAPNYQGQDPSIQERYTDDMVRRLVVEGTASEIYPGDHVPHAATNSKIHKDQVATFSSLNSFTSKRHEDKSLEEQQNLHESAKFAIASATFLESGGSFDDKALDAFLSEGLNIDQLERTSADGPRGERLAKLGEVTRAIIDGEIDIDDAIESGIVPKDQVAKFDASVLSVESGKLAADVSKVTNNSSDSEITEIVAKSKTVGSPSNPVSKNIIKTKV